jgi:dipeptidase E
MSTMPLYLSSYGTVAGSVHLRAPATGSSAAVVLNALDQFAATRARDLPAIVDDLAGLGWRAAELDLRRYNGDPDGLRHDLDEIGLIWVVGGNSFVLARAMTACGLRAVVADRLAADASFVYGGFSAGAVVAGPDLQGIELVDDPDGRVDDVGGGHPADALGLVPFRIVPHWRSGHPESPAVERVAAYMAGLGLEHRCLRDGQALWVDDATVTPVAESA